MYKRLGPILYARPDDAIHWTFDVGVLIDGSGADDVPRCTVKVTTPTSGATVTGPECAADFSSAAKTSLWRWRVRIPRATAETLLRYRLHAKPGDVAGLDDTEYTVIVPARGQLPRMVFFSCNGFSEPKYRDRVADHYGPWKTLYRVHKEAAGIDKREGERPEVSDADLAATAFNPRDVRGGYHLLLGGGDQLYADELRYTVPELLTVFSASPADRIGMAISSSLPDKLVAAFVDLYARYWSQPGLSAALARIPGLYTWDDHEVFDGWGSYDDALQASKPYQAVYDAARTTFEAFQLGGHDPGAGVRVGATSHFLQAINFPGDGATLEIVILDLRSDRTQTQVMSADQWTDLKDWIGARQLNLEPRHLLVISSIPLVHMRFAAALEQMSKALDLADDMRDQWESWAHRGERRQLIMNLLAHASASNSAVTLLSGDVHVAAHARISSTNPHHRDAFGRACRIEQLTSSGIVHPPPQSYESDLMEIVGADSKDDAGADVATEVIPFAKRTARDPYVQHGYLCDRNWLAIDFDASAAAGNAPGSVRLWAQWWSENRGPIEPQVVVEAFDPSGAPGAATSTGPAPRGLRARPTRRKRSGSPNGTTTRRRPR